MTTIPAWSGTLIPATAALACAMSASVTSPPAAVAGVVAAAAAGGDAEGAGAGLDAEPTDGAGADADFDALLSPVGAEGELWAEPDDAGDVGAASEPVDDPQPAINAATPSAATSAAGERRRAALVGRVTRTPSSIGPTGRFR